MTIVEAVRTVVEARRGKPSKYLWFRPASWIGRGEAYGIDQGRIERFPQPTGRVVVGVGGNVIDIVGEWEVVEPGFVNAENVRMREL